MRRYAVTETAETETINQPLSGMIPDDCLSMTAACALITQVFEAVPIDDMAWHGLHLFKMALVCRSLRDVCPERTRGPRFYSTHLDIVTSVKSVPGHDGEHTFAVDGAADSELARSVFRLARDAGWELGQLRPVTRDLETVFRELVREHSSPAEEVAA